jgi:4-amino-4-deoxy-L-arabinose transferase-like glycosyltransferase
VVTVNLLSSLIVVWGLWDLGRRWFGAREGLIAAGLFTVWPMPVQFVTTMASELHFMATLLLGLMAWDRARAPGAVAFWGWTVLAGLALAGATYVRPIAVLVPAALAVAMVGAHPRAALTQGLKAALVTLIILVCVAPWSGRNERVLGERVFMSTNFWANFWMGNHPGTNGEYVPLSPEHVQMGELERSAALKAISLEHLAEAPGAFAGRTLWKAVRLHSRETVGVVWNEAGLRALAGDAAVPVLKVLSTAWWYAVLGFALAGAALLIRQRGGWVVLVSPPVWLWLYFTGVHAVIVVGDRYHMPAVPMIALLASVALAALRSRQPQTPRRSRLQAG